MNANKTQENKTQENSRTLYFYADDEAALYDELAALTDPSYCQLHTDLIKQVLAWIDARYEHQSAKDNIQIVDIGCGTGMEGIGLLQARPSIQLIGVDISVPMLELFRRKLAKIFDDETASGRCCLVNSDIRDGECIEDILTVQEQVFSQAIRSMILSVYTLHHFDATTKAMLYRRIFEHLDPGGVFINADLFSFESSWLGDLAQSQLEEWIKRQFDAAAANPSNFSITDPRVWNQLKHQWLQHVREKNHPLPALSSGASLNDQGNAMSEQDLLLAAGFSAIECTFRVGQSGILWAFKGDDAS